MKRPINACSRLIMVLLCSAIAQLFATDTIAAPMPGTDSEQIAQLLDLLGVRAALEQTPAVLAAAIEAEAQFQQKAIPQAANWRRDLEAQLKPQQLLPNVARYLADHYRADMFQRVQQRLQEPLAKRARYFDLAMTQLGVEKKLRDFLLQNELSQNQPSQQSSGHGGGTADERRTLLREIDTATASSLLMAMLQSAIAARVHQAAGNSSVVDEVLLKDEIAERQRYLAPLAADYLLYDYRYLRDDELREYRDLLRDDAVQELLGMCRQAVLIAITNAVTQPRGLPQ